MILAFYLVTRELIRKRAEHNEVTTCDLKRFKISGQIRTRIQLTFAGRDFFAGGDRTASAEHWKNRAH